MFFSLFWQYLVAMPSAADFSSSFKGRGRYAANGQELTDMRHLKVFGSRKVGLMAAISFFDVLQVPVSK